MNQTDLMSPSKVAEQYGGDKQRIAQAVQMGLIDPTVGVMAGMFIDRVRGAAAQEQAPQTTVAQEVMQRPGLQAAAASPIESGLAALPVDESMVPGEGYAGGGIIAFEHGGHIPRYSGGEEDGSEVDLNDAEDLMALERSRQANLSATKKPAIKQGNSIEDLIARAVSGAQARREIPKSEYDIAEEARLKAAPERAQAAKDRAFWEFVTKTGFGASASKSPRWMQAFGESAAAATPTLTAGAKEARDIEEAGAKGLSEMGRVERAEKLAAIGAGEKMAGEEMSRESREKIARMQRDSMEQIAREKQTDFQRKWSLYSAEAKKRGVEPTLAEFQKLFPESKSGDFLGTVIKNNPYGDPASWFTQAEGLARLNSLQGEDRAAANWALSPANKDDPRAKAIRQRLGI